MLSQESDSTSFEILKTIVACGHAIDWVWGMLGLLFDTYSYPIFFLLYLSFFHECISNPPIILIVTLS
jgi:hypothetical protein